MPSSASSVDRTLRRFREVYREHYGFVWYALHRFGVAHEGLDDAVQETFLIAYRQDASRESRAAKGWLYEIARRVASNHRRTVSRRQRKTRAMTELQRSPSQTEETYAVVQQLDRFLRALPGRDRELFVLSEIEGMTGPEIARAIGGNVNTIYSRARKLRTAFENECRSRSEGSVRRRVVEDRPGATARSWALLVPMLGRAPSVIAGWGSALASSKVLSVAVGATLGLGALAIVHQTWARPTARVETERTSRAESSTQRPPPSQGAVVVPPMAVPQPSATPTPLAKVPVNRGESAKTRRRVASPELSKSSGADELARENAELARATRLLKEGEPARALDILVAQERTFPASPLHDLRIALHVEALCGLKQRTEARALAQRFLAEHPTSVVGLRIRRSCIDSSQDPARVDTQGP